MQAAFLLMIAMSTPSVASEAVRMVAPNTTPMVTALFGPLGSSTEAVVVGDVAATVSLVVGAVPAAVVFVVDVADAVGVMGGIGSGWVDDVITIGRLVLGQE